MNKIGVPLVRAIEMKKERVSESDDAQDVAKLLSRTVEMSVSLSQSLDLSGDEEQADSVRLSLAALSSPILADIYTGTQKVPDESDLKRISKIMESVLAFSDNFAPSQTHIARLQTFDGTPFYADETQNSLHIMRAMGPVFSALAEFSFGQSETSLMQDIFERLHNDAKELVMQLVLEESDDKPKMRHIELMILNALSEIYAQCHTSQTAQLIAMQEQGEEEPNLGIDDVWKAYDKRKALAMALVSSILPDMGDGGAGDGVVPTPVPAPQPEAQVPPVDIAPVPVVESNPQPVPQAAPQTPAPEVAPPPAVDSANGGVGAPMSFFKKPDENTPAPEVPPAAQAQPEAAQKAQGSGDPSGPMSFFKKPDDGAAS